MHALLRGAASVASALLSLLGLGVAVGAIVLARGGLLAPPVTFGPGAEPLTGLTAVEIKDDAAVKLEQATAKGSSGYAFEIVQTSTIKVKEGGPDLILPHPSNPWLTGGKADELLFYSLVERGVVTPAGFWSEIRSGPQPGETADFDGAQWQRSALMRDGVAWRNDREGWYRTDEVPGIGLDPATVALLPTLLRESGDAAKRDALVVGGRTLARVDATADKRNMPGLVAADGQKFTRLTAPMEFGFDDQGRVVWIHAVALNTNMTDYDLVVDTVITLRYDAVEQLPEPLPTWVPAPAEETDR